MLVEMSIKGLMLDPTSRMPIVVLRDAANERILPIWVGPVEANAIALQMENLTPGRPMTHDLIRDLLTAFGGQLARVIIQDLRDNTFFAYLEIVGESGRTLIDARPSDAIALALRARAPVFVDTRVLDRASNPNPGTEEAEQERLQRWLESLDPDDLGYKM